MYVYIYYIYNKIIWQLIKKITYFKYINKLKLKAI